MTQPPRSSPPALPPLPPRPAERPAAAWWAVPLAMVAAAALLGAWAVGWASRTARPVPNDHERIAALDLEPVTDAAAGRPPTPPPTERPGEAQIQSFGAPPTLGQEASEPDPDEPAAAPAVPPEIDVDDPAAVERRREPRDLSAANPADGVALEAVAELPSATEGGLRGDRMIDLGACPPEAAAGLVLDLAVPADGIASGRPLLTLERAAGAVPRWAIQWEAADAELEGSRTVADIEAAAGRLRMTVLGGGRRGAAILARAVLLVGTRGRDEPHEIRFVTPATTTSVALDLLGSRPTLVPLRLPPGVGPSDLQRGGCRIEIEVAGETHVIRIAAGSAPQPVTEECVVMGLAGAGRVGLRVEADVPRSQVVLKSAIFGAEVKGDCLPAFASLTGAGGIERQLMAWDKRFDAIGRIRLEAAVTKRDSERIDDFFRESFRLPGGYAPLAESAEASFDRFLRGNAGGARAVNAPSSFAAWQGNCTQLVMLARQAGGNAVALRDEWDGLYTRPLGAWWRWQRGELSDALQRLATDLAAARERAATAKIVRVTTVALVPGGRDYPVPLARFDQTPHPGDDRSGKAPLGLD